LKSAKTKKIETIYGLMLRDNDRIIDLFKKMGFTIEYFSDGTAKGTLNIKEE